MRQTPPCNPQDRFPGGFLGPAANELLGGSLQELVLCPYRKVLIKISVWEGDCFLWGRVPCSSPRSASGQCYGDAVRSIYPLQCTRKPRLLGFAGEKTCMLFWGKSVRGLKEFFDYFYGTLSWLNSYLFYHNYPKTPAFIQSIWKQTGETKVQVLGRKSIS